MIHVYGCYLKRQDFFFKSNKKYYDIELLIFKSIFLRKRKTTLIKYIYLKRKPLAIKNISHLSNKIKFILKLSFH